MGKGFLWGPTILRGVNLVAAAFMTGTGACRTKGPITTLVAAAAPIIVNGNGTEALQRRTPTTSRTLPSRAGSRTHGFAGNQTNWNV